MASDLRRFQLELDSYAKRSGGYPDDLDAFLDNHYGDASNSIRKEDWYKSIWYYDPTPPDSKNKFHSHPIGMADLEGIKRAGVNLKSLPLGRES